MMCQMHRNIWDLKSKFKKSISLKNRTIIIIERIQEEYGVRAAEAMEMLMEDENLYKKTYESLKNDGYDL